MLFDESYNEIKSTGKGLYKERGSRFVAYAHPAYTTKDVSEKLLWLKKKEKSASHYCYAYVLNPDKSVIKTNDDGEPKSTAGKPILTQIKKNNLTNSLVVVVRYFGGTKLGIPGLIRAYKNASISAIQNATIINKKIKEQYEIEFNYLKMNNIMGVIKKYNLEIQTKIIGENCVLLVNVLKLKSGNFLSCLNQEKNIRVVYKKLI